MKKFILISLFVVLCGAGNSFVSFAADTGTEQPVAEVQSVKEEQPVTEQPEVKEDSAAEEQSTVLKAGIEFDWVNMLQIQRDEKINQYHDILFSEENSSIKKKEFRTQYKDFLKDKDHKTHYRLISGGLTESVNDNMSGFFKEFGGDKLLIAYAIQPKKDIRHAYYYSAMGKLAYVDDMSENYPNFPYFSKQYRASGKLAGVIYFESKDLQYVYEPNGKFKGVWYKDKMFDKNGKEIMTRSNW